MEPIDKTIVKFRNHPIILLVTEELNNLQKTFSFEEIVINEVIKEIRSFNHKRLELIMTFPQNFLEIVRKKLEFFLKNQSQLT